MKEQGLEHTLKSGACRCMLLGCAIVAASEHAIAQSPPTQKTNALIPSLSSSRASQIELGLSLPAQLILVTTRSKTDSDGEPSAAASKLYSAPIGFEGRLSYSVTPYLSLSGNFGMQLAGGTTADVRYGGEVKYALIGGAPQDHIPVAHGGARYLLVPRWSWLLGLGGQVHNLDLRSLDKTTRAARLFTKAPELKGSIVSIDPTTELRFYLTRNLSLAAQVSYGYGLSSSVAELNASFFAAGIGLRTWL